MGCPTEISVCIVRGTLWPLNVLLPRTWVEVADSPNAYRVRLVFREFQDDDAANLVTLIATPQLLPDALPMEPNILIQFDLPGPVTQTLPDHGIVGFCEIYEAVDPANPTRLFNMRVSISD